MMQHAVHPTSGEGRTLGLVPATRLAIPLIVGLALALQPARANQPGAPCSQTAKFSPAPWTHQLGILFEDEHIDKTTMPDQWGMTCAFGGCIGIQSPDRAQLLITFPAMQPPDPTFVVREDIASIPLPWSGAVAYCNGINDPIVYCCVGNSNMPGCPTTVTVWTQP